MGLAHYQLIKQLGAGQDGGAYHARRHADALEVELRTLSGPRSTPERLSGLEQRLRRLALLRHPSHRAVVESSLREGLPFLVLEWAGEISLPEWRRRAAPRDLVTALGHLASLLAQAHRLGILHGELHPASVLVDASGPRLDFVGQDLSSFSGRGRPNDASFAPPEGRQVNDPAADVFAFGALWFWAMTGGAPSPNLREAQLEQLLQGQALQGFVLANGVQLLARSLAQEPGARPPAHQLARYFDDLLRAPGRAGAAFAETRPPSAVPPARTPPPMPAASASRAYAVTQTPATLARTPGGPSFRNLPSAPNLAATRPPVSVAATQPPQKPGRPPAATLPPRGVAPPLPPSAQPPTPYDAAETRIGADPNAETSLPLGERTAISITLPVEARDPISRGYLGRYKLREQLGQGGLGVVYLGEDEADGSLVAVKVIRSIYLEEPEVLARFQKEARLLASIQSPHVVALHDVNEDEGIFFLAMEYIRGRSVSALLHEHGALEEWLVLALGADIARALVAVHRLGIVHRDLKPENLLLSGQEALQPSFSGVRVKLSDFGLARAIDQTQSLAITRQGGPLGTPLYMSPEQCSERPDIDSRADIYSFGATLFAMLSGRPPFLGDTLAKLTAMHCNEPPPDLQKLNPKVSDALWQVIQKCLAKSPTARYQDAAALLRDLERVKSGEPTSILTHPLFPAHDPKSEITGELELRFSAPPLEVWPHFLDTEHLNRAIGSPSVAYEYRYDPERGTRRFGTMKVSGLEVQWEEFPYEWITGKSLSFLRLFTKGPLKWLAGQYQLSPTEDNGTRVYLRFTIEPGGLLGRVAARLQIRQAVAGFREFGRRIEAFLQSPQKNAPGASSYDLSHKPAAPLRKRLDEIGQRLLSCGVRPEVARVLCEHVAEAPPLDLARIRPLALARRLQLPVEETVAACLYGIKEGLFVLKWDLLCPACRVPAQIQETLKSLKDHGRCEACSADFALDFSTSVELILQAHPSLRQTELGTYCISNPMKAPHVVAQLRAVPNEKVELALNLPAGEYKLRGFSPLAFSVPLRIEEGAPSHLLETVLDRVPAPDPLRRVLPGEQLWVLENRLAYPLVVRIERAAPRDDALTAARASSLALFRELFPHEVLSDGQLVSVAEVTFLRTELVGVGALYQRLGEQRAFVQVYAHFRLLEERIKRAGGALVKTIGEGALAVFPDTRPALEVALSLAEALEATDATRELVLRIGLHRGPALVTTLNDQLDYFGTTIAQTMALAQLAHEGELVASASVVADPAFYELTRARALAPEAFLEDLPGFPTAPLHRVPLPRTTEGYRPEDLRTAPNPIIRG